MLKKTDRKERCPNCKKEVAVFEKIEHVRVRARKMGGSSGPGEEVHIADVCCECGIHFTLMKKIKKNFRLTA